MPMGYTHERPPGLSGGWACTSGGYAVGLAGLLVAMQYCDYCAVML
jgi:hypothetical protein